MMTEKSSVPVKLRLVGEEFAADPTLAVLRIGCSFKFDLPLLIVDVDADARIQFGECGIGED